MTCDTSPRRHQPSQAVSETRMPPAKPREAPYVHPAMLQAVAGPLWVCEGACDALVLRPRVCHVSWPSSACRAGAGTGSERCGSWSSPSTWMPLGSSSGARPPARVRCGGSGWPCPAVAYGGTRTSAKPGPRGCWRWARGLHQRRKMKPSRCLCTSASLGGVRCDHGHGRWPPARGSRAPSVGGALGFRRRAMRPAQWPRRCWRTWGGLRCRRVDDRVSARCRWHRPCDCPTRARIIALQHRTSSARVRTGSGMTHNRRGKCLWDS
jgi:hypothetical protein